MPTFTLPPAIAPDLPRPIGPRVREYFPDSDQDGNIIPGTEHNNCQDSQPWAVFFDYNVQICSWIQFEDGAEPGNIADAYARRAAQPPSNHYYIDLWNDDYSFMNQYELSSQLDVPYAAGTIRAAGFDPDGMIDNYILFYRNNPNYGFPEWVTFAHLTGVQAFRCFKHEVTDPAWPHCWTFQAISINQYIGYCWANTGIHKTPQTPSILPVILPLLIGLPTLASLAAVSLSTSAANSSAGRRRKS